MAPNISHIRLLSGPIGLRPASGVVIKAAPAAKDYRPTTTTNADDSAAYWQWESPKDLFSADHITANLTKAAVVASSSSATTNDSSSHDDYWAEAPANYWDERRHCGPVNASYWAEAAAPRHHEEAVAVPPSYWDEANHDATVSASDAYWREAPLPSQEDRYWQWSGSPQTARNRYWVM
jgi:hypothetical protein